MLSSTQLTLRCWGVAAWMARSIVRPAANCWKNAEPCAAARPAKPRSRQAIVFPLSSSSIRRVRFGTEGRTRRRRFFPIATRNSLKIAADKNLATIAFPAISTGVYGYPIQKATEVAIRTAREFIAQPTSLTEIIFCCFSASDLKVYEEILTVGSHTP